MQNLKLAYLAVLVPIGLLLPEIAAAHPEPFVQPYVAADQNTERHCHQKEHRFDLGTYGAEPRTLTDSVANQIVPPDTTAFQHHRDPLIDACGLDLNVLETN